MNRIVIAVAVVSCLSACEDYEAERRARQDAERIQRLQAEAAMDKGFKAFENWLAGSTEPFPDPQPIVKEIEPFLADPHAGVQYLIGRMNASSGQEAGSAIYLATMVAGDMKILPKGQLLKIATRARQRVEKGVATHQITMFAQMYNTTARPAVWKKRIDRCLQVLRSEAAGIK